MRTIQTSISQAKFTLFSLPPVSLLLNSREESKYSLALIYPTCYARQSAETSVSYRFPIKKETLTQVFPYEHFVVQHF